MGCSATKPKCLYLDEWKSSVNALDEDWTLEPRDPPILDESEFIIDHYISEGGMYVVSVIANVVDIDLQGQSVCSPSKENWQKGRPQNIW